MPTLDPNVLHHPAVVEQFNNGLRTRSFALFCAVRGGTVVRFAWFTSPARVGPLTAADIERTLSHVAWDGRTRPKLVVAVTTRCVPAYWSWPGGVKLYGPSHAQGLPPDAQVTHRFAWNPLNRPVPPENTIGPLNWLGPGVRSSST